MPHLQPFFDDRFGRVCTVLGVLLVRCAHGRPAKLCADGTCVLLLRVVQVPGPHEGTAEAGGGAAVRGCSAKSHGLLGMHGMNKWHVHGCGIPVRAAIAEPGQAHKSNLKTNDEGCCLVG